MFGLQLQLVSHTIAILEQRLTLTEDRVSTIIARTRGLVVVDPTVVDDRERYATSEYRSRSYLSNAEAEDQGQDVLVEEEEEGLGSEGGEEDLEGSHAFSSSLQRERPERHEDGEEVGVEEAGEGPLEERSVYVGR